jgi:hypothetical protein
MPTVDSTHVSQFRVVHLLRMSCAHSGSTVLRKL